MNRICLTKKQLRSLLIEADSQGKDFYDSIIAKAQKQSIEYGHLHKACMKIWNDWYVAQNGIKPKINPGHGKAMKELIDYLEEIDTTSQGADALLKLIFDNWDRLDNFWKAQRDLITINKHLNQYIFLIKNGNGKHTGDISEQIARHKASV